jgi:hypothetical protein
MNEITIRPDALETLVDTVVTKITEAQKVLPGQAGIQVRTLERDLESRMWEQAAAETARYATERALNAQPVRQVRYALNGRFDLLELALGEVQVEGFYAEFGVYRGASLGFIADRIDTVIYGFDSFEGLPEDWFLTATKGLYNLGGEAPTIQATQRNYRILKGMFVDTLPTFTSQIEGRAAFLHIDSGLFSSAQTALEGLADRIVAGTIIVFDEYWNYPGWREHEFKAFQGFCAAHGVTYRYLAFTPASYSVAVRIESVGG